MLFTLFLLGLLYVAFMGVLAAAGAGAVLMLVFIGGLLARASSSSRTSWRWRRWAPRRSPPRRRPAFTR